MKKDFEYAIGETCVLLTLLMFMRSSTLFWSQYYYNSAHIVADSVEYERQI